MRAAYGAVREVPRPDLAAPNLPAPTAQQRARVLLGYRLVPDADGKPELTIGQLVVGGEVATPTGLGYVVSEYSDAEQQPWTQGEPITLTSLHTGGSFAGNSGEVGLHYMSPDADDTGGSNGCIRIPTRDQVRSLDETIEPGDIVVVTE